MPVVRIRRGAGEPGPARPALQLGWNFGRVDCESEEEKGLPADRHTGEREHSQAPHRLTKETGRLEAAQHQHVLNFRPGSSVIWTGDDAVVVHRPLTVDIRFDDHLTGVGTDRKSTRLNSSHL